MLGGLVLILKVITPQWPLKLEVEPWRVGYALPWAVCFPEWWCAMLWEIPFPEPRDMDFEPYLRFRRLGL